MVKKTIPKITPKKGDSDSYFVDSPPITSNFSHASTSRYPIRSKDNSKGKQCESIGVVDKKIKKRVISVDVARRRRIIESEDEEDDDDRSEEAKVLVCNRKDSVQKTVRKKKNAKIGKARRREVVESVVDNRVLKEWDYYVPKGLTFTRARFSSHVNTSIVELLKLKLSSVQLKYFEVFRNFLDSSEEIQVKNSKCGSDLIDKVEELNQRREKDIIKECKLVKDDGEDIILRNGIEKIGEGFSSLKKYVEDSFASLSKDKTSSSDPINLQHHKKCSLCDAGRDVECPKEFVLRSEFEKLSSEFNLFKKLAEFNVIVAHFIK